jgi:hypothetical protein
MKALAALLRALSIRVERREMAQPVEAQPHADRLAEVLSPRGLGGSLPREHGFRLGSEIADPGVLRGFQSGAYAAWAGRGHPPVRCLEPLLGVLAFRRRAFARRFVCRRVSITLSEHSGSSAHAARDPRQYDRPTVGEGRRDFGPMRRRRQMKGRRRGSGPGFAERTACCRSGSASWTSA